MDIKMAPSLPRQFSPQPQRHHPLPSLNLHSQFRPAPPVPPAPPARILLLTDCSSARLSSSPASSPRVVNLPLERTRSIRPEMIPLMDEGTGARADFFEYSSCEDDGSEWEDDNGSPKRSQEVQRERERQKEEERERIRREIQSHDGSISNHERQLMAPAQNSNLERAPSCSSRETDCARTISLRHTRSPNSVHNNGYATSGAETSRESIMSRSNDSDRVSIPDDPSTSFPNLQDLQDTNINMNKNKMYSQSLTSRRHRRHTSESIRADSILNAHVITMKVLEALPSTASLSPSHLHQHHSRARARSFSRHRHPSGSIFTASDGFALGSTSFSRHHHRHRRVVLPPLNTRMRFSSSGPSRPSATRSLPPYFIKTPYPFSNSRKEFPKPTTRPRRQHAVYDYPEASREQEKFGNAKGKHILGIAASDGEFDLRDRLKRNIQAQGIVRSGTETNTDDEQRPSWGFEEQDLSGREAIIWLTVAKGGRWNQSRCQVADKVERIVIPPDSLNSKGEKGRERNGKMKRNFISEKHKHNFDLDFDDTHLAHLLRICYTRLTPPRFLSLFSAKKLRTIRLGRVSPWSGMAATNRSGTGTGRLLMTHAGFDMDFAATRTSFTEQSLISLYHSPGRGKGKYTWVNWARRVAAHNTPSTYTHNVAITNTNTSTSSTSDPHSHSASTSDTIITLQFTQSLSALRILLVLGTILVLSILSALIWAFLGEQMSDLSDRIQTGILLGVFVLLLQSVVFVAWVAVSWIWL